MELLIMVIAGIVLPVSGLVILVVIFDVLFTVHENVVPLIFEVSGMALVEEPEQII